MPALEFGAPGESTWVEFRPDGAPAWVGRFPDAGESGYRCAVAFADGRTALVLARGRGYVVDAVAAAVVRPTAFDRFDDGITAPGRPFVIASGHTALWAVGRDAERRVTPDVAVGFALEVSTPECVAGKLWDEPGGWYGFRLHFDGWRFERGPHLSSEWTAFAVPGINAPAI